jgi:DNA-binding response OmpR family regulator
MCDVSRRFATLLSQWPQQQIAALRSHATMSSTLPQPTILIVDDDTELAMLLVRVLSAEGWAVSTAATGAQGDAALLSARPDAVLLDVMLPDASGMDLCRRWRAAHPALGILMLTARGDPIDRILGLELGADDYLPKPFEKRELVARLRALLRRRVQPAAPVDEPALQWTFGTLHINLLRREVSVLGQSVPLTSVEFKLLVELTRVPGQAVSREQLNQAVQAGNYRPLDRTVDVQVGRLRRRLASVPGGGDWIETVRGEGYAFVPRGSGGTKTPRS